MAGDFILSGGGTLATGGLADRWTDLGFLTESVRNIIARPGTFATLFPETSEDGIIGVLKDGLAECQLEGLLGLSVVDDLDVVRPVLEPGQAALIVLYAGVRMMRAELLNRLFSSKYVAGPVSAETSYSAQVIRDILKALEQQKKDIILKLSTLGIGSAFYMTDTYPARSMDRGWLPASPTWLPVC